MSEEKPKICKDCLSDPESATSRGTVKPRPAKYMGPRCLEHHRKEKARIKLVNAERASIKVYGMASGDYDRLYEYQNGRCAICQTATGKVRRLAREHRHSDGRLRGLCCKTCNRIIGIARDNPEWFDRAAAYLRDPPAFQIGIVAIHQDNRINEDNTITPESW